MTICETPGLKKKNLIHSFWISVFLAIFVFKPDLTAQTVDSPHENSPQVLPKGNSQSDGVGKNNLMLFGTITFANSSFYADAFDRHLYLIGVRYGRVLTSNRAFAFSYTPEIIPVALLTEPTIPICIARCILMG